MSGTFDMLRAHDLLALRPGCVARITFEAPAWVAGALRSAPWAVVRRAREPHGIAIGIRGASRQQRFAAIVRPEDIAGVMVPEALLCVAAARDHRAFAALRDVACSAKALGLEIGPVGAAGFELATGQPALRAESDLDIVVRAGASRSALDAFAQRVRRLPVPVDVQCETEEGWGVALEELLAGGDLLARTPDGPRLVRLQSAS